MAERELEHVMRDFYQQRVNLLLCSTIIETGIDVPTANTIIIDRADQFGLAQLHQLRGRVGRSHHQAYAYLLTPPGDALSAQAKKRLEAIQMMEDLGSGFYLAMHDLEIRGAGEVLGESQSGEMQEIGFQLYNDMLKRRRCRALKSGREPDLARAARRDHRDQPARAGAAARALLQRRARAARPVQAARQRGDAGGARRDPGGTGRPLRAHAGARRRRCSPAIGCACSPSRSACARSTPGPSARRSSSSSSRRSTPATLILLVQKDGRIRFAGPDRIRIERAAPALAERVALVRDFLGRLQVRAARAAAAGARVRPRLAVGEQHPAQESATATC